MASLPLLLTRLGQVIRSLRDSAGYSQGRFAPVAKKHRTYMGLLERGKANPTVKTLHLVAEGLGLTVPELFALAAAESSETLSTAGGDHIRQGKDPATLVEKPTSAPPRQKGSARMAKKPIHKKPIQKKRKPGK